MFRPPMTSTDISNIMAAQQAQVMNNMSRAQQLSGVQGYAPASISSPQDPRTAPHMMAGPGFPTAGAQFGAGAMAAGGAGLTEALPFAAMMAGGAIDAARFGTTAGFNWGIAPGRGAGFGMLDPFTTVARSFTQGFWGGSGQSAAGIRSALGGQSMMGNPLQNPGLGSTLRAMPGLFQSRGMMGGARAVAGGLMGGTIAALPPALAFYTAGAVIGGGISNAMEGSAEYMATQAIMGSAGRLAMPNMLGPGGGGFNPSDTLASTRQIRNIAGRDPYTSVQDVQATMGGLVSGGHMRGTQSAQQFRQKFSEMTGQLKEISEIFHTSLQEAIPILEKYQGMGAHSPAAAVAAIRKQRGAALAGGVSSEGMTFAGGLGAQVTRAVGGTGAQGLAAMTTAVSRVGFAVRTGVVDAATLSEATGGLTGEAANIAFSRNMTSRTMRMLTGTQAGGDILAGLMTEGGTELDLSRVEAFQAGTLTMGKLRTRGKERSTGPGKAAFLSGFKRRRGKLAGQLVSEMGPTGVMSRYLESKGGSGGMDSEVADLLKEHFGGMSMDVASVLEKMTSRGGELDVLRKTEMRRMLAAQRQEKAFQSHGTWAGLKTQLAHEVTAPFERATKSIGDWWTRATDEIGRDVEEAITGVSRSKVTAGQANLYNDVLSGNAFGGTASALGGLTAVSSVQRLRNQANTAADLGMGQTWTPNRVGRALAQNLVSGGRSEADLAMYAGPSSLSAWGRVAQSVVPMEATSLGSARRQMVIDLQRGRSRGATGAGTGSVLGDLGQIYGGDMDISTPLGAGAQTAFNKYYADLTEENVLQGLTGDVRARAAAAFRDPTEVGGYGALYQGAAGAIERMAAAAGAEMPTLSPQAFARMSTAARAAGVRPSAADIFAGERERRGGAAFAGLGGGRKPGESLWQMEERLSEGGRGMMGRLRGRGPKTNVLGMVTNLSDPAQQRAIKAVWATRGLRTFFDESPDAYTKVLKAAAGGDPEDLFGTLAGGDLASIAEALGVEPKDIPMSGTQRPMIGSHASGLRGLRYLGEQAGAPGGIQKIFGDLGGELDNMAQTDAARAWTERFQEGWTEFSGGDLGLLPPSTQELLTGLRESGPTDARREIRYSSMGLVKKLRKGGMGKKGFGVLATGKMFAIEGAMGLRWLGMEKGLKKAAGSMAGLTKAARIRLARKQMSALGFRGSAMSEAALLEAIQTGVSPELAQDLATQMTGGSGRAASAEAIVKGLEEGVEGGEVSDVALEALRGGAPGPVRAGGRTSGLDAVVLAGQRLATLWEAKANALEATMTKHHPGP